MPQLEILKVISVSVAAGTDVTETYIPRETLLVKRIFVTERGNANLSNVFADIDFMGVDLTDGNIPLAVLGNNTETAFPIEKELEAGNGITFKIINNLSKDIKVDIVLELHPPA